MKILSINTFEDIHHVCLMGGLKAAYLRLPFLADNIMLTPPPFRRNPDRRPLLIGRGPVNVQYFKKVMQLIYDQNRVSPDDISAFAKAVVEEYMRLRHPYMKCSWNGLQLVELQSGHLIADII